jgi:hypothetical protein
MFEKIKGLPGGFMMSGGHGKSTKFRPASLICLNWFPERSGHVQGLEDRDMRKSFVMKTFNHISGDTDNE